MKKTIQYAAMLTITGLLALIIYCGAIYDNRRTTPDTGDFRMPPKIVKNGPFGVNVELTEQMGPCIFQLKAGKLYVTKSKTFGFDNALFKKMVAENVTVTIYKNNRIMLKLHKDQFDTPPDLKRITIKSPDILFPAPLPRPDRVVIEKKRKRIVFKYGNKRKIWDLNQEIYQEDMAATFL